MRKLLYCAASTAVLVLAANADAAAPKHKVPVTPARTQGAPKPAASGVRTTSAGKPLAKPAATSRPAATSTRTAVGTRRPSVPITPKRPATSWRNRQAAPTPERYKEIQEALAAKGYLQPEDASGRWDQASVDALKKFQADQKLDSTGRLNSLSLIALGLGPKYEPPSPAGPAENAAPTVTPVETH
jgi:hypothetical protein